VIDNFIREALSDGADTVLNLGAGLDTRPYRLDLPADLRWIEADFPEMISYKSERLASDTPRCRVERVAVDLANDDRRRELFREVEATAKKLLVLTEGVTPYLTNDEVGALADDLHSIAIPKLWIVDYVSRLAQEYRRRSGVDSQMRNAPFRFKPDDWFHFFAGHGWHVRAIRYLPIEGRRIGRRFPVPARGRSFTGLLRMLFSGKRRRQFAQSLGFALLEPR
jgi:methyltransferase (TIGR00027 family)